MGSGRNVTIYSNPDKSMCSGLGGVGLTVVEVVTDTLGSAISKRYVCYALYDKPFE